MSVGARSIRARLRRSLLLWLGCVLVLGGAGMYAFVRTSLIAQFDTALLAKARALASDVKIEAGSGGRLEFDFAGELMPEFERARQPEYFELWTGVEGAADGGLLQRSATLGAHDLARRPGPGDGPLIQDLRLPDGRSGRAVWLPFTPGLDKEPGAETTEPEPGGQSERPGPPLLLAVARSRSELDRPLGVFAVGLLGCAVLVCGGAVLGVHRALRAGLAPLERVGASVAALRPDLLPERLDVPPLPRELEGVRARLDDLLGRLREAFARERGFTDAAAHELRTPLAELRALLDVRLKWPEDVSACTASMERAREVGLRMERVVEVLLNLARQSGRADLRPEPIDLGAELRGLVARYAGAAESRGVTLAAEIEGKALCVADRAAVASVINNLLANAVQYTSPGGAVRVEVHPPQDGRGSAVVVVNGPTDLTAAEVPSIFVPFWRKDQSRTPARGGGDAHLGLGLSLADGLARQMGASLTASMEADGLRVSCVWAG